jgi:hypothetical protein
VSYRILDHDTPRCQEFVRELTGRPSFDLLVCIGLERDGVIVAATGFNYFNGRSAHIHLAIREHARLIRQYIWFIFHYAFVQAGLEMLIALMPASNKVVGLNQHFGFSEQFRLDGAHPDGAMILQTLHKTDCRFLSGRYAKVSP